MPRKREISGREVSYSEVKNDETNVLRKIWQWERLVNFFNHLYANRSVIRAITAHHLGINVERCHIADTEEWLYGSFNLCVPISISSRETQQPTKRVIMRFPQPYKVGGPENANEKLRCEAATYIWLQENCPSVPIPGLHGFGLSTRQMFTPIERLPLFLRLVHLLHRRLLTWLGFPVPSRYVRHQGPRWDSLRSGYMLIDFIEKEEGQMLSCTWGERRQEDQLRKNLFRGLSRILLDIARVPLPRIGSFTVDDKGFLRLANRPLPVIIHQYENDRIPVDIPRHLTYSSVDAYAMDLLNCVHDSRLRHQPNGISHRQDAILQISALAAMKAISSIFLRRDLRYGPFFFNLTDLHQSNIFVDEDWNITRIIDLECAFACPVEMIHPPSWLTNQAIDQIDAKTYGPLHNEFLDVLEQTELEMRAGLPDQKLSTIMRRAWELGTFWYNQALHSPPCLVRLFYDHIQPIIANGHEDNEDFYAIMVEYWTINRQHFIKEKLADKENYDRLLRQAFDEQADEDTKDTRGTRDTRDTSDTRDPTDTRDPKDSR